jgi:hypothetical protein
MEAQVRDDRQENNVTVTKSMGSFIVRSRTSLSRCWNLDQGTDLEIHLREEGTLVIKKCLGYYNFYYNSLQSNVTVFMSDWVSRHATWMKKNKNKQQNLTDKFIYLIAKMIGNIWTATSIYKKFKVKIVVPLTTIPSSLLVLTFCLTSYY